MIECLKMHKENFDYCLEELIRESEEKDKEIERLTKQNKALNEMYELTKKEYIRLNNIIKEVREYIENSSWISIKELLEILDKGVENGDNK